MYDQDIIELLERHFNSSYEMLIKVVYIREFSKSYEVMTIDISIIERLLSKSSRFNKLKPSSEESLNYLQITGYPESFIEFYRQYEPDKSYNFADITLYDTHSIKEENTNFVPGAYIFPLGFIAFASNLYGDTYCFNLSARLPNEPQVLLVSLDEIYEDVSSVSEVLKKSRLVASNFEEFLSRLVDGTLVTEYYID